MRFPSHSAGALAVLFGVVGAPAAVPATTTYATAGDLPAPEEAAPALEEETSNTEPSFPTESCLATTVCQVKEKIRWKTPAWTADQCRRIARAILDSAERHGIRPGLLLAVMINESDLNEKAARDTHRAGQLYARDSGLMGIRCIIDKKGRCANGNVRGVKSTDLMDPVKNIDAGARELAYWRNGGAITRSIVKVRDASGRLRPVMRGTPCKHKTHAYWAHYNHGPRYIETGVARHYPHRVAVIYHALATAMGVKATELTNATAITIHDPGRRVRTADQPVEARHRKLCQQILEAGAGCGAVASSRGRVPIDTSPPLRARLTHGRRPPPR